MHTVEGPRVVTSVADWRAGDLEPSERWRRRFHGDELAELDRALRHARTRSPGLELARLGAADFPMPGLEPLVDGLRDELIDGCGLVVLDGFDVSPYSTDELRAIWWGLSLHIGRPVAQSWRGDLIGDVRDLGTGITGKAGRGYTSNVELGFHSDASDVTGLFFLAQGASGGESRFASSVAVHNELARRRPDLLELLYQPMPCSWQSNERPGDEPWYPMPVFGRVGADTACAYVSTNVLRAADNVGAPPLDEAQIEAVRAVGRVAAEPGMWFERRFEPGAMVFTNNHTVLHSRTEFRDHPEPERKRHLLRIWLSMPNSRALPPTFASYFGDVRAGAERGGYPTRSDRPVFETRLHG